MKLKGGVTERHNKEPNVNWFVLGVTEQNCGVHFQGVVGSRPRNARVFISAIKSIGL